MLGKKLLNILQYIKCLILYFAATVVALFVKNRDIYKNLWIVAERGKDARDNGYHFFKYICQNHKEINCVYVIDEKSSDFDKVSKLGKTVQTGSFRHYLMFSCAKVKISTHIMGYAPDSYRFAVLDRKFGLVGGKKVFLQHGIINNDIKELRYGKARLDLFICTTTAEFEALSKYGYPEGVLKRIGLCRYDALDKSHNVKRQILVMPTWRYYLRKLDENGFKDSEYYRNFNALINDKRLQEILEDNDYELAFYLHYELQKFSNLFSAKSERIKIKTMANSDVQELLKESAMLITDYSSVFFDFAYMRKPLAYWTFDYDLFYNEQYGEGYLRLKTDGFGPNLKDKDEVIDLIEYEIKNDMALDATYAKRIEDTFAELENGHCEKTFEAIKTILKGND